MANPLIRKLSNYVHLSEEERKALESLAEKPKRYAARTDIIHEGDPIGDVYLILTGWPPTDHGLLHPG